MSVIELNHLVAVKLGLPGLVQREASMCLPSQSLQVARFKIEVSPTLPATWPTIPSSTT
jgi:hypothetical protein